MRTHALARLAVLTSHPIQYYAPLFRELARLTDLHVFYAHRATPQQQADAGFGVPFDWDVDLLSGYDHSFLKNVSSDPGTSRFSGCDTPGIFEELRRGKFDVVLSLGWHLKSLMQGIWAAKRLRLPVMVRGDSQLGTPRSSVKRAVKELVYPLALQIFDAALYVGQRSKAYFRHYGIADSRLFYSPHCVDTEWFAARATPDAAAQLRARYGIGPAAKLILFAGKLVPFKRPGDVILSAAACRAKGMPVEVMVAGTGALEQELVVAAAQLNVPLHMLGFLNQTQMPAAYAACDALVLPSNGRETWGLVANEALACGRPVLVSDACGCAPDVSSVDNGEGCFPVGDTGVLARRMESYMRSPPPKAKIRAVSEGLSLPAARDGIMDAMAYAAARR